MNSQIVPTLGSILSDCIAEKGIDDRELAELCECSHQTIRNIQAGKSISAGLASRIIQVCELRTKPDVLRSFLLAFLHAEFLDSGEDDLLKIAGLY